MKTKILFIVPDGVSLRNFVYTSFYQEAETMGMEVIFLNLTMLPLTTLGLKEIIPQNIKQHPLTDSFKNAKKRIELNQFIKQFNDPVYHKYWFALSFNGFNRFLKSSLTKLITIFFNTPKGLRIITNVIRKLEGQTTYYKSCKLILEDLNPDLVYCASQRAILAIAPVEAAKKLGIPTTGFIYSWDNLPKSMLDVETDYYHVWSEHMKRELLTYYPFVNQNQVIVTGTPQFESHFEEETILSRPDFYVRHQLNGNKTYICFSGDDMTTSPQDPMYLRDLAATVKEMNHQGYTLGILFRRCPVDFSNRYDLVLEAYQDIIVPIAPLWESIGEGWNAKSPTQADTVLLANIAAHCKAVINLGSSMVFDFAIHGNPCGYMNYHYTGEGTIERGVHVYDYVHFRSMPKKECVVWLDHPDNIKQCLIQLLEAPKATVEASKKWFQKINLHPPTKASVRILEHVKETSKRQASCT